MDDPDFPCKKDFGNGKFAYIVSLTFGRARINVAPNCCPMTVDDGY